MIEQKLFEAEIQRLCEKYDFYVDTRYKKIDKRESQLVAYAEPDLMRITGCTDNLRQMTTEGVIYSARHEFAHMLAYVRYGQSRYMESHSGSAWTQACRDLNIPQSGVVEASWLKDNKAVPLGECV